ncbi:hypothetical protein B0H16DRAFT_1461017 [Mycena metata]|uniref:Uncharacterized protein n=1 Tax=Mycena metata TaxID=1033252 RepID=A0AAD7IWE4_9AGAR|nr:hypothetical protein B0H16DRAFT_1461017 [Mycena metata]
MTMYNICAIDSKLVPNTNAELICRRTEKWAPRPPNWGEEEIEDDDRVSFTVLERSAWRGWVFETSGRLEVRGVFMAAGTHTDMVRSRNHCPMNDAVRGTNYFSKFELESPAGEGGLESPEDNFERTNISGIGGSRNQVGKNHRCKGLAPVYPGEGVGLHHRVRAIRPGGEQCPDAKTPFREGDWGSGRVGVEKIGESIIHTLLVPYDWVEPIDSVGLQAARKDLRGFEGLVHTINMSYTTFPPVADIIHLGSLGFSGIEGAWRLEASEKRVCNVFLSYYRGIWVVEAVGWWWWEKEEKCGGVDRGSFGSFGPILSPQQPPTPWLVFYTSRPADKQPVCNIPEAYSLWPNWHYWWHYTLFFPRGTRRKNLLHGVNDSGGTDRLS